MPDVIVLPGKRVTNIMKIIHYLSGERFCPKTLKNRGRNFTTPCVLLPSLRFSTYPKETAKHFGDFCVLILQYLNKQKNRQPDANQN